MEAALQKIEARLLPVFAGLPHLPVGVRRWLANNIWWLLLVLVIFLFFVGAVLVLLALATGLLLLSFGNAGAVIAGILGVILAVIFLVSSINFFIWCFAIPPLKAKRKLGWLLLLLSWLVSLVGTVLGFLFSFELFSLTFNLLSAFVSGYLLFEIRNYFGTQHAVHAPPSSAQPPHLPQ